MGAANKLRPRSGLKLLSTSTQSLSSTFTSICLFLSNLSHSFFLPRVPSSSSLFLSHSLSLSLSSYLERLWADLGDTLYVKVRMVRGVAPPLRVA